MLNMPTEYWILMYGRIDFPDLVYYQHVLRYGQSMVLYIVDGNLTESDGVVYSLFVLFYDFIIMCTHRPMLVFSAHSVFSGNSIFPLLA